MPAHLGASLNNWNNDDDGMVVVVETVLLSVC